MISEPKTSAPPKIQRISMKDWMKGYISAFDDGRMPNDGLKEASNVQIEQNGTVRPRPSTIQYGVQPLGTVLGIDEFVKMNGSVPENWMISIQVVAGVAEVYINKDGGSWTKCTGKTYNITAKAHFCQIDNKVLITNGEDFLSYLNIPTSLVIPFVALTTVTGVVATPVAAIAGTNYTLRYKVTASNQGETAGSTASVITVGKLRDVWVGTTATTPEYVDITWNRVTGASRYNIYVGTDAGYEYYLDTVTDLGSGATQTYRDGASVVQNTNRLVPTADSTAGVKSTRATNVSGQIFLVGNKDNPSRIDFGGTIGSAVLDFSAFNGGGWIDINVGSKEIPVKVVPYRTGKGDPAPTVLFKSTNGAGSMKHLATATETLGETVINYIQVFEANGQDGTDSPDGVVSYRDSLWYPSRDAFKTTGTKPQVQNILSTSSISDTIINDIKMLDTQSMNKAQGVAFEGRIYWSLPVGTTTNNQIWILDLNRGGLWTLPWYINADNLWLYGSNDGRTHLLALVNNKIVEFSYGQATNDAGTAFSTGIGSGLIKFSDDGAEWASVIDITFVFLRPTGNISVSISGKTEDDPLTSLGGDTFVKNVPVIGWGEAPWGSLYWGETREKYVTFGLSREETTVEIDEDLNWLQWRVSSSGTGVDYQLSDVIIQYVPIGVISK